MPRLRSRPAPPENSGPVATLERDAAAETARPEEKLEKAIEQGAAAVEDKAAAIKPWDMDSDSLPQPARDAKGRITAQGEPRYYIINGSRGSALMKAFKAHGGVHRRHVRNLRDDKAADVAVRKRLRKLGIPGA